MKNNFLTYFKLLILIGNIFFVTKEISAQSDSTIDKNTQAWYYIESRFHSGKPISYSDLLTSTLTKPFSAQDIRFGIQTLGQYQAQFALDLPTYGLGFYNAQLSDRDTLGNPFAAYVFYNASIFQRKRFSFNWEMDFGLAWHFKVYDPITNPRNDLISNDLNIFYMVNLNMDFRLSERLDLTASYGFTHFSNGTYKLPNKGLNMYGGTIGCKYHFANPTLKPFKRIDKTKFQPTKTPFVKKNELNIMLSTGVKAIKSNKRFPVASLEVDYYRHYAWIGRVGGGLDYFYDGTYKSDYDPNNLPSETRYTFLGIHAAHELSWSQFSLVSQIGTYLWKGIDSKGSFYFRVGLRYNFSKHFYANLTLKTLPVLKADYLEFGGGLRLFNK